jgi:hypothetical protein
MIDHFVSEVKSFILRIGGSYGDWYVGISKNAARRLFGEHRVEHNDPTWIYLDAENAKAARALEMHFLVLGCDGGSGGGDDESRFLYVYRKTRATKQ